jgi:hypothetical protein
MIVFLLGCTSDHTRVHLAITADAAATADNYELRIGEHTALAAPLAELDLVLPDDMAGSEQPLSVWALHAGQQVAFGSTTVTPRLHGRVDAAVTLSSVSCGAFCMVGAVECSGDGTSTCEMQSDGCVAWSAVAPCPSSTPYCSGAACSAQCTDDCTTGQTVCDTSAAIRQCGQYDSDTCLDWSPPIACTGGQTCSGGTCGTTVTCGHDGDACDDGNACTVADSCESGTCTGMPTCTSAPANADPTCRSDGTCGFTCRPGYVAMGSNCVAEPKVIFVSSMSYAGNLGGLAGADAKCQLLATAAGVSGAFKAWLSDATHDARDRLFHAPGPYLAVNSVVIAANWNELVSGVLETAAYYDENGFIGAAGYAWTGTAADGTESGHGTDCQNWTSSASSVSGDTGLTMNSGPMWTSAQTATCNKLEHLYCLEQ